MYTIGFWLMEQPFPFALSLGAILVRVGREIDSDEDRQLRAWDKATAIIKARR